MLPCIIKKYTGFDCAGCGIQRSLSLIIKGEFAEAFYMYPAIYTLLLFFCTVCISIFYKFKFSGKLIALLAILNILIIFTNLILKYL